MLIKTFYTYAKLLEFTKIWLKKHTIAENEEVTVLFPHSQYRYINNEWVKIEEKEPKKVIR